MAEVLEYRSRRKAAGDGYPEAAYMGEGERNALTVRKLHVLDSTANRDLLRKLLQWYYFERDRQAANRLEMAIDHDFYDNLQWKDEDAATLVSRGQAPLVYNEVAPMCDWIIGTERRNRVDWKVLPRAEDDVQLADVKTKVLKYVSDLNRVQFARSRAFADSVKGGLGWMDDGVRDDPTKDILYSKYEDWRCVLHDSSGLELDTEDWRYVFRWRWVDEDIACMMFPDRADRIRSATEDVAQHVDPMVDEDTFTGRYDGTDGQIGRSGSLRVNFSAFDDGSARRRVKLIECQYRMPVATKIVTSGPHKGAYFHPADTALADALAQHGGMVIDKITMRAHVAVFTETDMLACGPSIYRHNRFSLTPIWCYRRSRDRMPYGVIRRVRDVQEDLNKRASKALHLLNTNQIVADKGAVDDIEVAREEAQMPDGYIEKRQGSEFIIRRDTDAATGQIQIMAMDAQAIQKSGGVNDENRGLKTNAISGEAIRARQLQGAVVTTEPFDNLRLAVQVQGSKQLSLVEQFYTEEKVIRLTGAKGALEWIKINQPELQADGSYRFLNDLTSSMADFVVSEQDYAGTLRQVMFDAMQQLAQKLPPEVALRFLTIAFDFSDLPNKDEISDQLRKLTGERDPNKPMSPEEAQQAQEQMQQQAQAMEVAKQTAMAALQEQQGKAREINARADKLMAEAQALAAGGGGQAGGGAGDQVLEAQRQMAQEAAIRKVQEAAAEQIDNLSQKLARLQADQTTKVMQINKEADTAAELARIKHDSEIEVANIAAASTKQFEALIKRIDSLASAMDDARKETKREVADAVQAVEAKVEKKVADVAASVPAPAEPAPAAAPAAPAQPPITLVVQAAPAAQPPQKATVKFRSDKAGDLAGATLTKPDGTVVEVTVEPEKE